MKMNRKASLSRERLYHITCFFLIAFPLIGEEPILSEKTLFATVAITQGYTVGGEYRQSGLFRLQDGSWEHLGFKHPRIEAIAVHPKDPEVIYLAAGNGVLRSRDGGVSWRIVTDWRQTLTKDIAVDPNAPEDVYLATPHGLWISRNRGDTWNYSNNGIQRPYVMALGVDWGRKGHVLAGFEQGIFRSENGGLSWKQVGAPGIQVTRIRQSASHPQLWLAATQEGGLFVSQDGGSTWQRNPGVPETALLYCLAIDPNNPDRWATGGYQTGLWLTHDAGKTWKQITQPLESLTVKEVVFNPDDPQAILINLPGKDIYRSRDDGKSWASLQMPGASVWEMEYLPTIDP